MKAIFQKKYGSPDDLELRDIDKPALPKPNRRRVGGREGSDRTGPVEAGGTLADLNLMAMTGGRERTRELWEVLLARAGLTLTTIHSLTQFVSVMEVQDL